MKKLLLLCIILFSGCSWQKVIIQPLPKEEPKNIESQENSSSQLAVAILKISEPPIQLRNTNSSSEKVITKIVVNIPHQRLYAYQGNKIIKEIVVSTAKGPSFGLGQDSEIPHNHIGTFSIIDKDKDHISVAYGCPMPYAMRFYRGHYIHATTTNNYRYLGSPASHGCVRTNLDDAKWLFERTAIGTPVIITNTEVDRSIDTEKAIAERKPDKKTKGPDLVRIN